MMDRASFLQHLAWASIAPFALSACGRSQSTPVPEAAASDTLDVHPLPTDIPPLDKSKEEWKAILDDDAYRILFEAGTEPRQIDRGQGQNSGIRRREVDRFCSCN